MLPSQSPKSSFKYFDIIMTFFVVVLVLSNIASSAKIVDLCFSVFGIRLAFDGGTLLFPLAYVLGDILTEVYGFKAAKRVIWTGFGVLAFSSLVFFVLKILPGESSWEAETGSAAYNAILGGLSSGGLVLASLAGYLVGESRGIPGWRIIQFSRTFKDQSYDEWPVALVQGHGFQPSWRTPGQLNFCIHRLPYRGFWLESFSESCADQLYPEMPHRSPGIAAYIYGGEVVEPQITTADYDHRLR